MKRKDLDEKLNSARQRTKTWSWFNESSDETLAELEADLIKLSADDFPQKYPFSKQAARDWLGLSATRGSANVDFAVYSKPPTPYKKITIVFAEGTYENLKQSASYLTAKYGYPTKYSMDSIIRAGIKAVEESK